MKGGARRPGGGGGDFHGVRFTYMYSGSGTCAGRLHHACIKWSVVDAVFLLYAPPAQRLLHVRNVRAHSEFF